MVGGSVCRQTEVSVKLNSVDPLLALAAGSYNANYNLASIGKYGGNWED